MKNIKTNQQVKLRRDIMDTVNRLKAVTFVDLMLAVKGFAGDKKMPVDKAKDYGVLWPWMSDTAMAVMEELLKQKKLVYFPTTREYYKWAMKTSIKETEDPDSYLPNLEVMYLGDATKDDPASKDEWLPIVFALPGKD